MQVNALARNEHETIAEDSSFDISSITRAFYNKQIEHKQRIPLTLERPKPNKESLESIRVANEIARNGEPTYASAKEMLEAMECRHSKGRVHRKAPSRRKAPQEETLRPRTA